MGQAASTQLFSTPHKLLPGLYDTYGKFGDGKQLADWMLIQLLSDVAMTAMSTVCHLRQRQGVTFALHLFWVTTALGAETSITYRLCLPPTHNGRRVCLVSVFLRWFSCITRLHQESQQWTWLQCLTTRCVFEAHMKMVCYHSDCMTTDVDSKIPILMLICQICCSALYTEWLHCNQRRKQEHILFPKSFRLSIQSMS